MVCMVLWGGVGWVQNGKIPLSIASGNGHVEAMKLLLDRGAYVDSKDKASTCEMYMSCTVLIVILGANYNILVQTIMFL